MSRCYCAEKGICKVNIELLTNELQSMSGCDGYLEKINGELKSLDVSTINAFEIGNESDIVSAIKELDSDMISVRSAVEGMISDKIAELQEKLIFFEEEDKTFHEEEEAEAAAAAAEEALAQSMM